MEPGKLRHRITIQYEDNGKDDDGFESTIWKEYKRAWAAIIPLRGKEFYQAATINAEISIKIVTRYIKGVDEDMRIKYGDRSFEIISIIDVNERHREMHFMCKEVK